MAIKGCMSIAEYIIRRWLMEQGFAMEHFTLAMIGNEAFLHDENGDTLPLVYDSASKTVYIREN